jgi:hypothetical protein
MQKFEFQYRDEDNWKNIFTGTTLGDNFQKSFQPVTAHEFRLNILDASEGPTINEIQFLSHVAPTIQIRLKRPQRSSDLT